MVSFPVLSEEDSKTLERGGVLEGAGAQVLKCPCGRWGEDHQTESIYISLS